MDLICWMWKSDERGMMRQEGCPMAAKDMSKLVFIPVAKVRTYLAELKQNGVSSELDDGTVYCRRMVREEEIRQSRVDAGRKGGQAKPKQNGSKHQAPSRKSDEAKAWQMAEVEVEAAKVYSCYPRKQQRRRALVAIAKAHERGHGWEELIRKTRLFAAAVDGWEKADRKFIPYPASWFNADGFDDDPDTWDRSDDADNPHKPLPPYRKSGEDE